MILSINSATISKSQVDLHFPKREDYAKMTAQISCLFIIKSDMELNIRLFFHKNSISQTQVGVFLIFCRFEAEIFL